MSLQPDSSIDRQLWLSFKAGDRHAFGQIYRRQVKALYSYGRKLTSDSDLIEDSVQDLFVDLWNRRSNLADVDNVRFYLFKSLRHRLFKSLPGDSREQHATEFFSNEVTFSHETELIHEEEIAQKTLHIRKQLQQLPHRQYEVVTLYFFYDLSYSEIAELLDINTQSVRNLLQRAVLHLRRLIGQSVLFTLAFFL